MKQILSTLILFAIYFSAIAQNTEQVDKLIQQGLALHEKGEYAEAIKKYNAALDIDKDNFDASYEKSFSLIALGKSKEAAILSKDLLKKFAGHPNIEIVYIQYGSILDDLGKGKEAIEVYNEGIAKFPNEYLLHFNKGLIYHKMEKFSEALVCYENSLKLNPLHALANLYTGIIIHEPNPIPALLAYSTFLAIEPATKRSKDGYDKIQNILNASVKREKNSTSVFIDQSLFLSKDTNAENYFKDVELLFITSEISKGAEGKSKSPSDNLAFRIKNLIDLLSNSIKAGKGFYWKHYVPFFIDMKDKNHVSTLAHLMYKPAMDEDNDRWIEQNDKAIEDFYDWLKTYKWSI